ncbi:na[+]-dependent inorganic phosphate cotransporter [Megalopta genalis]|uniref:na[+]-dependent inorganic phosphate cotransporter n=1 Tax=Megalopta genalis TaxID=115081 RepID=UPI003FD46313
MTEIIMTSNVTSEDCTSVDDLIGKVKSLALLTETPNANARYDQCMTCVKADKPLSNIQMAVYHILHEIIDQKVSKIILIDAPSGTGKSHLLSSLAKCYDETTQYAVFRRDQASELSLKQISAYTYVSYNMRNFKLNYHEALMMFNVRGLANIDILYKLITYASKYVYISDMVKAIILDAYTIVSPFMLLLLYIVSLKHKITLIFAGNKLQLSSISTCSEFHNSNNFDLIEVFNDVTINELTANLRSDDKNFLEKVSCFRDMIASYKAKKTVPFHFNLRYFLYCLFRNKFDPRIQENFAALYMAPFHHTITQRLYRFMKNPGLNQFRVESFPMVPFNFDEKIQERYKFFPGLLLVKGFKYFYVTSAGVHHIVVLEEMIFVAATLAKLVIRYADGNRHTIEREELNYYQILPAYRTWLEHMQFPENKPIYQFPLKPYTLTYHAVLGRTISDIVEFSTNCSDASSIYVGLCSLPSESHIHKFHAAEDFLSFLATDFMATVDKEEYYYRCPPYDVGFNIYEYLGNPDGEEFIKSFLMGIGWITVSDINTFEDKKSTCFLRIKRSEYEKRKKQLKESKPTTLMEMTKFVKDKPSVILDTMKNVHNDTVDIKNIKSKKWRQSPTYKSLVNAYNEWFSQEKAKDKAK